MLSNIININKKSFLALTLVLILMFSVMAPTVMAAVEYDADYELKNNITGEVLDFSNRVKFDFSKSSNRNSYGDLTTDGYEIKKEGHNYTIKFKDLTAKKVILPYDDSDVEVAESSAEEGTDPRTVFPNLQRHLARKTHITIELEGTNKITGYGISGGYTKGVTIKGSGSLEVQAHLERKTEKVHNMTTNQDQEETNDYIVPGIVLETDEINYDDPNSGFIIEATGKIKINSPYYWGIIVNGDIKFADDSNVEITADPSGEKRAQAGAISADHIIKEDNATVIYSNGAAVEHKKDEPLPEDPKKPKDTTPPVITAKSNTGEEIRENGSYCENPVITVTDDKEIDYIKVNGITITKFKYNSWTEKTFELPTYLDAKKVIVAKDTAGNETKFEFTSNNGHITLGGEEIERVYATCTTDGFHKIQYKCRVCGKVVRTETVSDKALGHHFGNWTATGVANKEERKCTRCEYTETRDATVKMTDTKVYLSSTNYVYDGNRKEPTVTVKAGNKTLVNGKDYTVNYDNNVKAGTATVTVTGKNVYKGTTTANFKIEKKNNTITATDKTVNYSKKAQTIKLGVKQAGDAKLTYSSNNKYITVNSLGVVTVKAGYVGKATITITANDTTNYNKATKKITIAVNKINNKITASNFTKKYSTKAQSFSINAKQAGDAKLTYSSNNKNVKVNSSGKVTIAKGFIGAATITITAKETAGYKAVSKKITIIVNPPTITISKLSNSASKKMTITWKKNTAVTGYEIQYSTDKAFKKGVKTVKITKNSTTSKVITGLTKNKTYYVRIRSYKTVSRVNYYSGWTVKNIKIKK